MARGLLPATPRVTARPRCRRVAWGWLLRSDFI